MPTDDERRAVAAKCYEAAYRERFTGEAIARAIGTHTSGTARYDHDSWLRLKALVEPGYSEITPKSTESTPKFDRDALLSLADEMEGIYRAPDAARWYARRIREACGEEADHAEA